MKSDGIDLKAILAVCLLTDGSMQVKGNHFRISFSTSDLIFRDLIFSLINELSVKVPSIDFTKKRNYLIRVSDELLGHRMLALSPNYKTSPTWKHQTKEEYLQEPQPTLKFLAGANQQTKLWALRFGFTSDGCISVRVKGQAAIELACYHPTLAPEWKDFAQSFGFKINITKSKNSWCIISGIRIQTQAGFKKFYNLGGFIDDVKISRKSKRFCGMAKNELLEIVVNGGSRRI